MNFLKVLLSGKITAIPALPFKGTNSAFADIALLTNRGDIWIRGKAADIKEKSEAFYLDAELFSVDKYWRDKKTGKPAWPPSSDFSWQAIDLLNRWIEVDRNLISGPREVQLFADDESRDLQIRGAFGRSCAISLLTSKAQVVLYATPEFPCGVEVITETSRADQLLKTLARVTARQRLA